MTLTTSDLDVAALSDLLRRKASVRGEPVAICKFTHEIHPDFIGREVEPCAIVRHAMDLGERAYVDAQHQACLAGAWQAGFVEPPEQIKDGSYLSDSIPGFLPIAANRVKTGENVLPYGMLRGIGATPLKDVPDDLPIDTLVVVCEPVQAATLAGVRTAVDGTPPRGAAGSSLCGELFAIPHHDRNVIMTPGDMGGRMFNKVRPSEMFVIIPIEYAGHLVDLLSETPDVPSLMEAIKPGFLEARQQRLAERAQRQGTGANGRPTWTDEATAILAAAPDAIREFAGPTLEEYAVEHGHPVITLDVMRAQMDSIGMRLEDVLDLMPSGDDAAGTTSAAGASLSDQATTSIDPKAPIRAEALIEIDAVPATIWPLIADVGNWERVYDQVREVTISGPASLGSTFSFKTGPGKIDARVSLLAEHTELTITGKGMGATSIISFTLEPSDRGAVLRLGQSMSGMAVRPMKRMLQGVVETAVVDWADAIARHSIDTGAAS